MAPWKNARTRREVTSRAGESLRERADPHRPFPGKGEAPSLLDIALNHLTLGRAALYAGADGGCVRRLQPHAFDADAPIAAAARVEVVTTN